MCIRDSVRTVSFRFTVLIELVRSKSLTVYSLNQPSICTIHNRRKILILLRGASITFTDHFLSVHLFLILFQALTAVIHNFLLVRSFNWMLLNFSLHIIELKNYCILPLKRDAFGAHRHTSFIIWCPYRVCLKAYLRFELACWYWVRFEFFNDGSQTDVALQAWLRLVAASLIKLLVAD